VSCDHATWGSAGGGHGPAAARCGARDERGNGPGAVVQGGRRAHDAPGSEGEARRCRVGRPRKETEWAEPG
jgi:hypothetical protein